MDKQTNRSPRRFQIDIQRIMQNHLISERHTPRHKFIFGSVIMLCGISLVKGSLVLESGLIHFFADAVGYLLHGIGAIPIIKSIEEVKGGKL